jgi:hypothetical protein
VVDSAWLFHVRCSGAMTAQYSAVRRSAAADHGVIPPFMVPFMVSSNRAADARLKRLGRRI